MLSVNRIGLLRAHGRRNPQAGISEEDEVHVALFCLASGSLPLRVGAPAPTGQPRPGSISYRETLALAPQGSGSAPGPPDGDGGVLRVSTPGRPPLAGWPSSRLGTSVTATLCEMLWGLIPDVGVAV